MLKYYWDHYFSWASTDKGFEVFFRGFLFSSVLLNLSLIIYVWIYQSFF